MRAGWIRNRGIKHSSKAISILRHFKTLDHVSPVRVEGVLFPDWGNAGSASDEIRYWNKPVWWVVSGR